MAPEYLRQAAAIPMRGNKICLVTSSNGKRWVIPKGLIDPGHTSAETALNEVKPTSHDEEVKVPEAVYNQMEMHHRAIGKAMANFLGYLDLDNMKNLEDKK